MTRAARAVDRALVQIWRRGLTRKPPLDPDYLWAQGSKGFEAADEFSGRSAADAEDFRLRLDKLCRALNTEADLTALGHTFAYGQITGAVRRRHALGRLWRERPELLETPIAPPIVVVGHMRSGSTRMQRLLAADPRHCGTRFCDSHDPVPRTPDLRPLKAWLALLAGRLLEPRMMELHPFAATRTDEEIGWLSGALNPCAFEAQWMIPSFVRWSEAADPSPVYREFKRILRTDAASRSNADRPRVLKCPQFAEDLPALLETFPDARLVVTRRDPESVLRSSVALVSAHSSFQSRSRTSHDIEIEWKRKIDLRERRIALALAGFTGARAEVEFEAMGERPAETLAKVYSALALRTC